jgi:class 3 adenylate cyclase
LGQLGDVVARLTAAGTADQVALASAVLEQARRDLHRVLAGETS